MSSDDAGAYTCVAMNNMGRAEGTVSLEVQGNQILLCIVIHNLFAVPILSLICLQP